MKAFIFSAVLAFALAASVRAEFYLYQEIGTTPSYTFYGAAGINNNGEVVGTAFDTANRPVAVRYAGGVLNIAPSPGPSHSTWGNGINATGTIVGLCDRTGHPSGNVLHVFYANPGSPAVDFDSNFTRNSEAKAINDSGYVVGTVGSQAFLGHTSGWIFPLASTLGNNFVARGLNNSIVVVGNSAPFGGLTYNAWTGDITFLGFALGWNNEASAINASGVVAGKVGTQGFLYNAGVVTLFGSNITTVSGINGNGDVVGTTSLGHGFVYLKTSGHFLDLNTVVASSISSIWTLVAATGINDHGAICGSARRLATAADGPGVGTYVYRAFKITPFIFFPLPLIQ